MRINSNVRRIGLSPIVRISELAAKVAPEFEKRTGKPFIYFQRGEVGYKCPAFLAEAMKEAIENGFTKYPKAGGEPALKEAILETDAAELNLDPSEIVITSGGQEALQLIMQMFSGGTCGLLTPAWPCLFENIFPYTGMKYKEIPLRAWAADWTIDFEAVEAAMPDLDVFYFNSPHNPTGRVFSEEDITRLAALCQKYGVILVCDDAYKDLVYKGQFYSPLLDEYENVIAVRTFSKSFAATGFRLGYAVSRRRDLIAHMMRAEYTQTAGISSPTQHAFAQALRHPQRDEWQNTMRLTMKFRSEKLVEGLGTDKLGCAPEGAFYWFGKLPDADAIRTDDQWVNHLLSEGIAIVPGSAFGEDFEGYARLSFSTLDADRVLEGAKRFASLTGRRPMEVINALSS